MGSTPQNAKEKTLQGKWTFSKSKILPLSKLTKNTIFCNF